MLDNTVSFQAPIAARTDWLPGINDVLDTSDVADASLPPEVAYPPAMTPL